MAEVLAAGCAWNDTIMIPDQLGKQTEAGRLQEGDVVICGIATCGRRPRLSYESIAAVAHPGLDRRLTAKDPNAFCPVLQRLAEEISDSVTE